MRHRKGWLMARVAVIIVLAFWVPGALAFWPPCQQVNAWLDSPNQTVHYDVYDSKKGAWVPGSWTAPQVMDISGPLVSRGIVYWKTTVPSSGFHIYCRVYDPGRSLWQGKEWLYTQFPTGPWGGDGTLTWLVPTVYPMDKVVVQTYDPGPGVWKGGEKEFVGNNVYLVTIKASSDVVALSLRTLSGEDVASIYFGIYDPSRGEWRFGEDHIGLGGGQMPSILIDWGTVIFGDNRYGYDAASGSWSRDHDTQPLAWFVAQPTVGKAPLWVWFTDMSFGGPPSWTFGDGSPPVTDNRSPSHTYTSTGKFTVTQQVVRGEITSSSSQEIRVRSGADLTPALDLLLLE
jgi:hypothetical protein